MPRFEVLAGDSVVGWSELEGSDPPMGTVGGRFFPLPAYESIQPMIVAARDHSQAHLALTVRTADGRLIPAQGGVQILDYSAELGADGIEVHVYGIGYPLYEELFPGRHAAYVEGFKKA